MSAEVIALLRRALQSGGDQAAKHQRATARLDELRRRSTLPDRLPAAEQLVREDRDAGA